MWRNKMSLINLNCKEIVWGEIFPGCGLIQIGDLFEEDKPYVADNGVEGLKGRFGLTFCNDPAFIFTLPPIFDSIWGLTDEEVDDLFDEPIEYDIYQENFKIFQQFDRELNGDFHNHVSLYLAITAAGWNQEEHGFPGIFISHKMAEFIEEHKNDKRIIF